MALDPSPSTTDALSLLVQRYNQGLPARKQITNDVDFVLTGPLVPGAGTTKNTEVRAVPKTKTARRGPIRILYDRYNLAAVTSGPTGWDTSVTTLYQLLPLLNAAYGLSLQQEDVTDGPVTLATTSLTAKPTSLRYTGTLTFGPSSVRPLSEVVTTTVLDGFELPA